MTGRRRLVQDVSRDPPPRLPAGAEDDGRGAFQRRPSVASIRILRRIVRSTNESLGIQYPRTTAHARLQHGSRDFLRLEREDGQRAPPSRLPPHMSHPGPLRSVSHVPTVRPPRRDRRRRRRGPRVSALSRCPSVCLSIPSHPDTGARRSSRPCSRRGCPGG